MKVPPMDDTYIHLVYGRSLFSGAPLCYNGSIPSSGFTSPLWLVPSSLASLAGPDLAPVLLMGLSLAAALAALLMLEPGTAALLMLAGPFLFHASSGMETALSCIAVIAVWKWIEGEGTAFTGGLLLAGAFLVRPELVFLAAPMLVSMRNRTLPGAARLLIPPAVFGILWMLWNMHAAGLPLPSTFYAKQAAAWPAAAAAGMPGLFKGLLLTSPLLLFAAAASVITLLRRKDDRKRSAALALVPVILFFTALATQPNAFFQMRYYVPAITASALAAGLWLRGLGKKRRRLNLVILAVSMIPGLLVFSSRRLDASIDVLNIDVTPARYLREAAGAEETVAAADIGAVKWISGMEVLDLDGLVTPERLPGSGRAGWPWVRERADYLLAFPIQYSSLVESGRGSLEFLAGFGSPACVICGEDSVALWRINQLDRSPLSGLLYCTDK